MSRSRTLAVPSLWQAPFAIVAVVVSGFVGAGCNATASLPDTLKGVPPAVDAGPAVCPNDDHVGCPTPEPSYTNDIVPILEEHCLTCHRPGGLEPTEHEFTTYASVYNARQAMEDQVNDCLMPPVDAGLSLPTASRVTLLTWLECGAPNN